MDENGIIMKDERSAITAMYEPLVEQSLPLLDFKICNYQSCMPVVCSCAFTDDYIASLGTPLLEGQDCYLINT